MVQLADFMCPRDSGKSNRAILINIGAGWCLPCQAETLEFPELYDEYHDQGLEIVQVMFQNWTGQAPTGGFCEAWSSGDWSEGGAQGVPLDFPVLIDQVFDWGSTYLQNPDDATPINMLVDANGNIRWKLEAQQPSVDVLRAQIELVIEEPYAPPS
jgi:thiol-disulfide isomerase/thioredoxin